MGPDQNSCGNAFRISIRCSSILGPKFVNDGKAGLTHVSVSVRSGVEPDFCRGQFALVRSLSSHTRAVCHGRRCIGIPAWGRESGLDTVTSSGSLMQAAGRNARWPHVRCTERGFCRLVRSCGSAGARCRAATPLMFVPRVLCSSQQ